MKLHHDHHGDKSLLSNHCWRDLFNGFRYLSRTRRKIPGGSRTRPFFRKDRSEPGLAFLGHASSWFREWNPLTLKFEIMLGFVETWPKNTVVSFFGDEPYGRKSQKIKWNKPKRFPSVLRESLDFGSAFRVIPFLNYILKKSFCGTLAQTKKPVCSNAYLWYTWVFDHQQFTLFL